MAGLPRRAQEQVQGPLQVLGAAPGKMSGGVKGPVLLVLRSLACVVEAPKAKICSAILTIFWHLLVRRAPRE